MVFNSWNTHVCNNNKVFQFLLLSSATIFHHTSDHPPSVVHSFLVCSSRVFTCLEDYSIANWTELNWTVHGVYDGHMPARLWLNQAKVHSNRVPLHMWKGQYSTQNWNGSSTYLVLIVAVYVASVSGFLYVVNSSPDEALGARFRPASLATWHSALRYPYWTADQCWLNDRFDWCHTMLSTTFICSTK